MSNVLADAPGDHCFTGVQHEGNATGSEVQIAGVNTYVAKPPTGGQNGKYDKIILFFADVYGPLFNNNKLLQDYFASKGFFVVGLDYFNGDPVYIHADEAGFDRAAWMKKSQDYAEEKVPTWVTAVKEQFGIPGHTAYTAIGYCFGAPYVMKYGADKEISAGAICHPAFLDESHFENLKVPLLLCCAEIDHTFPLDKRRRSEDILLQHKNANYHYQVFGGVKHGFAIRCNLDDPYERWVKEHCADTCASWFGFYSTPKA